ncbi:MAG TPA: hypothetical protein VK850_16195 [Candidatus Binatia bacterium]|nr:hypothetical protein [Candidatus Binatia bacterium]
MGDLMEDLRKEKDRILLRERFGVVLKAFVAGFLLTAVFAVPGVIWFVNVEIHLLKEQATTANERREKWEEESRRQTRLAEQYRDRFLAVTKTNGTFAGFRHEDLQTYALRMVRALQTPIREHETNMNKLEGDLLRLFAKSNVADFKKALEEKSTAEWEAGQRCMAVYNVRFKADVLTLRREILSRIPVGNDIDNNGLPTDYWYDSPWNFYGFKKMVADLDRIARQLPISKEHAKKPVELSGR